MTLPTAGRAAAPTPGDGRTQTLAGPFVLNLCSSTTPMALAQVELPELKRFTFFVSRRFEEGRERFRLHMGYFATLAEAEEWLGIVREIYPGAWAGEAPGKKLRERATAAAAAQARQAVGPRSAATAVAAPAPVTTPAAPAVGATPVALAVPAPVPEARPAARTPSPATPAKALPAVAPARAASPLPAVVPTLHAPAAPAAVPQPVRAEPAAALRPSKAVPTRGASPAPPAAPAPIAQAPAVAQSARPTQPPPTLRPPEQGARASEDGAIIFSQSNVREVLAELDHPEDTGATRAMPMIGGTSSCPAEDAGARALESAPTPAGAAELSDTQVLRMLELRRDTGTPDLSGDSNIALLKPDDTGTRRALKQAVTQNAPVAFAVQLHWSVQPIAPESVPPLAIFSAYTLYSVEGSRDGRKWYGLRLGFFSDANSAKQVAHYVRSEFNSVAVVPVSPQEKARATDQDGIAARVAGSATAPKPAADPLAEFKLIDDGPPRHAPEVPTPAAVRAPAATAARAAAPAASRAAAPADNKAGARSRDSARPLPRRRRAPAEVNARERRGPHTLEETLEILGAGELEIDNGRGETLNDSGVRHLRVEVQKNTPFSKLLERLSDRIKKP